MRFLAGNSALFAVAAFAAALVPQGTRAQDTLKVGLILPMTGPLALVGRQAYEGAKLYLSRKGDTLAGKKVELLLKDDGGAPERSRSAADELIVRDKVQVLGVTSTPNALAVAPVSTNAKVATIVMASAFTGINLASPYFIRTSYTLAQLGRPLGEWLAKNGSKTAAVLELDGLRTVAEAGAAFKTSFAESGGKVVTQVRVPPGANDFTPFLQTVRATKPDTLFAFVFAQQAPSFARQFKELGIDREGTKLVGLGELTDEDILARAGESLLGVVTAGVYSTSHESAANKEFVDAFRKATNFRPNVIAVAGYDGMNLLDEALKKNGGKTDGDALIEAMKGAKWESPRGPIAIDPKTRDIIQNVYIRRVESAQGEFYNSEIQTYAAVSSEPPVCCVPKTCPDMGICGRAAQ